MEDETMFLCGYKRTPRYGTTPSNVGGGPSKPSYNKIIKHKVVPSDTLQGIALKYGSQITEIKRLNKLWSNDSIHLREILIIPVLITEDSSSTTLAVGQNILSATTYNGPAMTMATNTTDSCYSSMSEGDQECSSSTMGLGGVSPRNIQLENGAQQSSYDKSDLTVSDFLERIDSNIKVTSRNVKRLEKQSTVDKLCNNSDPSSSTMPSSFSRQSFQDIALTRTPSPTEVRTAGTSQSRVGANKASKSKQQHVELQEIHDGFFQL